MKFFIKLTLLFEYHLFQQLKKKKKITQAKITIKIFYKRL